jgi:hypothetical protein
LGIDLNPNGANANDAGDGDIGANNRQNYPVLASAIAGSTNVQGSLDSAPNTSYSLEFFSTATCDASGNGEGASLLGTSTVATDGSGDVTFNLTFGPSVPPGQFVTGLATDPNDNTSEFSPCIAVTPPFTATPTMTSTATATSTPTPTPTKQPEPGDTDQDGCSDQEENGLNEVEGGLRNYRFFWDFFDTPNAANARDKAVASADFNRVLQRFGANDTGPGDFNRSSDPLSAPNAWVSGAHRANYHPAFDRGPTSGPNTWNLTAADGAIASPDFNRALQQFGHNCN